MPNHAVGGLIWADSDTPQRLFKKKKEKKREESWKHIISTRFLKLIQLIKVHRQRRIKMSVNFLTKSTVKQGRSCCCDTVKKAKWVGLNIC